MTKSPTPSWFLLPDINRPTARRHILFLQGPAGPFFRELAARFEALGHAVSRINFHAGDWLDWGCRGLSPNADDCLVTIERLCRDDPITDLVCYGDCRPYHARAIAHLASRGARIHVFEEGYLRPDHVTLESGGVNANSPLRGFCGARWRSALGDLGPVPSEDVGPTRYALFAHYARYYTAAGLLSGFLRNSESHREVSLSREACSWISTLGMRATLWAGHDRATMSELAGERYFLVPLQLDDDYQRRAHSSYASIRQVVEEVLASFAACAPPQTRLVFKRHPLDGSPAEIRRRIFDESRRLRIERRVHWLFGGHWPGLVKTSAGVVTINSTAGLSALHHGRPVIALGEAFWKNEATTPISNLDSFWSAPQNPDAETVFAMKRILRHVNQINGSFFTSKGRRILFRDLARKQADRTESAATLQQA